MWIFAESLMELMELTIMEGSVSVAMQVTVESATFVCAFARDNRKLYQHKHFLSLLI